MYINALLHRSNIIFFITSVLFESKCNILSNIYERIFTNVFNLLILNYYSRARTNGSDSKIVHTYSGLLYLLLHYTIW